MTLNYGKQLKRGSTANLEVQKNKKMRKKAQKTTKTKKSDIKLIANNKDNIITLNNNNSIKWPHKPNTNIRILLKYFKELLLIGNINISLDVSKIGRRKGNEWIKRGKISLENNIVNDQWYVKFYELTTRTHARFVSSIIQKLIETNNRGGNNLQWILEQQAPNDFKKLIQENNDSNATQLILALQNPTEVLKKNKEKNSISQENKV